MTARSLSQLIDDLHAGLTGERVSVDQILEAFHERGFGFLLFIFAAPMALPLPDPPIVNIILASPMVLLTAQQALGRHTIWLPARLRRISVSRQKFDSVMLALAPWIKRMEKVFRPRMEKITQGLFSHLIGLAGLIMALTACIPVPMTHTIPSIGIVLMAIGVIMRDGGAVIAGMLVGIGWITMLVLAVTFFGAEGLDMLKTAIKSFF